MLERTQKGPELVRGTEWTGPFPQLLVTQSCEGALPELLGRGRGGRAPCPAFWRQLF